MPTKSSYHPSAARGSRRAARPAEGRLARRPPAPWHRSPADRQHRGTPFHAETPLTARAIVSRVWRRRSARKGYEVKRPKPELIGKPQRHPSAPRSRLELAAKPARHQPRLRCGSSPALGQAQHLGARRLGAHVPVAKYHTPAARGSPVLASGTFCARADRGRPGDGCVRGSGWWHARRAASCRAAVRRRRRHSHGDCRCRRAVALLANMSGDVLRRSASGRASIADCHTGSRTTMRRNCW
jgi:hypothetical protein